MGKFIDLTGQRFGKLVAIKRAGTTSSGSVLWLCQCDCGNTKKVSSSNLRTGHTKSCGCLSKENKKYEDLTGQIFERLTVVEIDKDKNKTGRTYWLCKCSCGNSNLVSVSVNNLKSGNTKSCGCLKKERSIENLKKVKPTNIKDLTGQKFGRLTVIKRDEQKTDRVYWLCQCDCGNPNLVSIRSSNLTSGDTKSCGCLKKEGNVSQILDLTNQRFGALVALYPVNIMNEEHKERRWHCKCDCGNEKDIPANRLRSGNTTSCGCQIYKRNILRIDYTGQVFGKLTVLQTYRENNITMCKCQCECGNIVNKQAKYLRDGSVMSCGCLHSKGEQRINKILTQMNINFIQEKTYVDLIGDSEKPLRFDFYLLDYNVLIEYQGEQHYEPQNYFGGENAYYKRVKYDNLKRDYCQQNDIKLIEIPYWDFNEIDENYLMERIKEENINDKD